jgi:hypothetical protein
VTDSRTSSKYWRIYLRVLSFYHVKYDMPNGFAPNPEVWGDLMYVIVRKMNLPVLWIRIWSDPDPVRGSDPDPEPDRTFLIYKLLG